MSDYTQVTFDIAACPPVNADLLCKYAVKPEYVPGRDWIGLFKVGWSSVREAKASLYAPILTGEQGTVRSGDVLFSKPVPEEDGEFYQFVYFNRENQLRGASKPFQFKDPEAFEFIEDEINDDMLFISSRQSQLESKIQKLEEHVSALEKEKKSLEDEYKRAVSRLRHVNEELEAEQKTNLDHVEYRTELTEEKKELLAEVANLKNEMLSVNNERDAMGGKVVTVEQELTILREYGETEKSAKLNLQSTVADLEMRLKSAEIRIQEAYKQGYEDLEKSVDWNKISDLEQQQVTIQAIHKGEIELLNDRLMATEARKKVYEEEMLSLRETLQNVSGKLEETTSENLNLKQNLNTNASRHGSQKKDFDVIIDNLNKEKNLLLSRIGELGHKLITAQAEVKNFEQQNDQLVALKLAYDQMKNEHMKLSAACKKLQEEKNRLHKSERLATRKVCELEDNFKEVQSKFQSLSAVHRHTSITEDFAPETSEKDLESLTRGELMSMIHSLSADLEMKTQKKEKYKQKYLDEKQRAAAMRDYYVTVVNPPANSENPCSRSGVVVNSSSRTATQSGGLPEPLVPTRVEQPVNSRREQHESEDASESDSDNEMQEVGSPLQPQMRRNDEEEETEAFHDAADQPVAPVRTAAASSGASAAFETSTTAAHYTADNLTCKTCNLLFPTTATEEERVKHIAVNHMGDFYSKPLPPLMATPDKCKRCPVCARNFGESITQTEFEDHVNNHFD